jgi:hypothetical protein
MMVVIATMPIAWVTEPEGHDRRGDHHTGRRNHDCPGRADLWGHIRRGRLDVYRRGRCHNDSRRRRKRYSKAEPHTRLRGGYGSEYHSR